MLEKEFEDIICKYPELIEEGLILTGRQLSLYGRRMDVLFEDKFKRKLIIELKAGPIKDDHIGQIMSYEGMLLSDDDPTIRVMLVGTRVPPNMKKSMDYHGIAWKEITFSFLKDFLKNKGEESFNHLFEYNEPVIKNRNIVVNKVVPQQIKFVDMKNNSELIENLKSSENYKSFKNITLNVKKEHEERARLILEKYHGNLNHNHFKEIIELVDGPSQYPYEQNGKIVATGAWFGRTINSNKKHILNEDHNKINQWFKILSDNHLTAEKRIELLLGKPNKIKGINVGFITLILHLLDKNKYSIWFGAQHDGLKLIYPKLEKYTGKSNQYPIFNDLSKEFIKKYNFEDTELDWILTTGLPNLNF
jgi:DNA-directed RNA polymerase subunit F